MKYEFLKLEKEKSIGVLTIQREDKLNALSEQVLFEIRDFFLNIKKYQLNGLIITGAGQKAFIAGADIGPMQQMRGPQGQRLGALGQEVAQMIEDSPLPVIACVNGYALGGGNELALACDFIYASESAMFGQPEVKLGLIPGFGGCIRLSHRIGAAKAKELIYTGNLISAIEALEIGLVNRVFPDKESLLSEAKKTLKTIGQRSAFAVQEAKGVINALAKDGDAFNSENRSYFNVFAHPDKTEGVNAFLQKRKPQFTI